MTSIGTKQCLDYLWVLLERLEKLQINNVRYREHVYSKNQYRYNDEDDNNYDSVDTNDACLGTKCNSIHVIVMARIKTIISIITKKLLVSNSFSFKGVKFYLCRLASNMVKHNINIPSSVDVIVLTAKESDDIHSQHSTHIPLCSMLLRLKI